MRSPARPSGLVVVLAVGVLLAVVGLAGCGGQGQVHGTGSSLDVVLPSLDGGDVALADLRGRIVIVHFFTTWSLASQMDLEELRAVADLADVVGVALDKDGRRLIVPWRQATGVRHVITLPTEEIQNGTSAFGPVQTVPTTFVLDREGRLVWRHEGGLPRGELRRRVGLLR